MRLFVVAIYVHVHCIIFIKLLNTSKMERIIFTTAFPVFETSPQKLSQVVCEYV